MDTQVGDCGGAEGVPHPGCCILEAGVHTLIMPWGADVWDNVDVPAWDSHLSPGNLKTIVILLLSQQCREGRALTLLAARRSQLWWQSCG